MTTQRYSVTPHPISTLLAWVNSGEIAIPEIQRPFVWDATKVRNLLDSLYNGYPVGYLIAWRNPTVKLKDGTHSSGKRILIDGQQRVTALMAALLGHQVLTKDYRTIRIRIAFHPVEERFEVRNPAIEKDPGWIDDIQQVFDKNTGIFESVRKYQEQNLSIDPKQVETVVERLSKLVNNHVGLIELAEDLDIETVTEIFIRVNSAGTPLSQADFAMSKIAVNESHGGHVLRKAIDYFCHLAVAPEFFSKIEEGDSEFVQSKFWPRLNWLRNVNDDFYDPTYTDMLRVAFTSKFGRGRLQDLVALLSGRNFETREYEEEIAEKSFSKLSEGIEAFMDATHFNRVSMIIRSGGFLTSAMIRSQNAFNFAFILYLHGRDENIAPARIESLVRRWYIMSILTQRYSGNPETAFDVDIRQVTAQGLERYVEAVITSSLPETYWTGMLPQLMDTSSSTSPYFVAYQAAQVHFGDKGFLSKDISVRDLLLNHGDRHHVYPRKYLQSEFKLGRGEYNQIANFVVTQSEINIAIGASSPKDYFGELLEQVAGGHLRYGGIDDIGELKANLSQNCVPVQMLNGEPLSYDDFLEARRKLMALKIRDWFQDVSR
ncbi:MAG: DUF262 domain-containing protein [Gammaproteobacteria bacterium]|nr:DUF262 domain-containing protein [Gammaproteobacteria bacterium]MYD79179.1 DUF262 domain-containing protein [Gammaproteobacteria bacterium]